MTKVTDALHDAANRYGDAAHALDKARGGGGHAVVEDHAHAMLALMKAARAFATSTRADRNKPAPPAEDAA